MDIIADVMGHAEPARLKAATRLLQAMSTKKTAPSDAAQFQLVKAKAEPNSFKVANSPAAIRSHDGHQASSMQRAMSTDVTHKKTRKEAMQGLETVLATKMVEAMMPKDQSRLYGEGTAGEIWRGLHIDAMGKALASRGLFSTSNELPANVVQRPLNTTGAKLIVPFAG
jgi:peptidoglycan hydrolase FlgJ